MMKKSYMRRWLTSDAFADGAMASMIIDWVAI
jgi:hypothetical protein